MVIMRLVEFFVDPQYCRATADLESAGLSLRLEFAYRDLAAIPVALRTFETYSPRAKGVAERRDWNAGSIDTRIGATQLVPFHIGADR
jgi:hypothetical protein